MFAFLLTALIGTASAEVPNFYSCRVILVAKDISGGVAEKPFTTMADSGSHGGGGFEFAFEKHKVGILADAKWMAISWMRDGKNVSQATFSSSVANSGAQVLILANPADVDEQVSLDCNVP